MFDVFDFSVVVVLERVVVKFLNIEVWRVLEVGKWFCGWLFREVFIRRFFFCRLGLSFCWSLVVFFVGWFWFRFVLVGFGVVRGFFEFAFSG